ncbi:MAG: hypothetical protein HY298_05305 [Verrucomicrobia bacterium]|nr:hypothetical protein [Verrucomicrobiota bacterium]
MKTYSLRIVGSIGMAVCTFAIFFPLPDTTAQFTVVNATESLANLTGGDPAQCEQLLTDLTGSDPATLLEGLTAAEAEELMELVANLTGLGQSTPLGSHSVGVAKPKFRKMAGDLEKLMPDHLWYGNLVPLIFYATEERTPGEVVSWFTSHSQLSSGMYLAAESFRYAVAKHNKNGAKNHGQGVVWDHEVKRAKARIDELLTGTHRAINIAKNWKGATVNGEPGMLFRFTWEENSPIPLGGAQHGIYLLPWDDGKKYWCLDNVSRDMYDGVIFGLLVTFDLVGPDDPVLQAVVRDDIVAMADYYVRHGWCIVYPVAPNTEPVNPNPLFVTEPAARLRMVHAARHVARAAGTLADRAKWDAIWAEEWTTQEPFIGPGYTGSKPHDTYYGFNFSHLRNYDLIMYENDPGVRAGFRRDFAIMDATTRDDVNAHFEAITYAMTGEPGRLDLAVTHLGDWLTYRDRWYETKSNSSRCGTDIECIPEDQVTYDQKLPDGSTASLVVPGSSATKRSAYPLPVGQRHGQYFIWLRSPYTLDQPANTLTGRAAGHDFLLPYYMLRYYTEVTLPPFDPLPSYAGPTIR